MVVEKIDLFNLISIVSLPTDIMNNFFYTGSNPILIREWNDKINIVTLDWLMKNYDSNNQVYCSVIEDFVCLTDLKFEKVNAPVQFTLKRIKSLYGLVDVIEKFTQRTLLGCLKICKDVPNPQFFTKKDLPAYCMGFFFHCGRIYKNKWIIDCYSHKIFKKFINILTKKFPHVHFDYRKVGQTTHKGSSIWEISVDKTRNNNNKDFVQIWGHWFIKNNTKVVPQNILNATNTCKREFMNGVQDSLETGFHSIVFNNKLSCAQIFYLHLCLGESVMINQDEIDIYSFNLNTVPKNLINNNQIIIEKTPIYLKHPENLYKFEYIPNFKKGELGDRHVLVGIGNMVL